MSDPRPRLLPRYLFRKARALDLIETYLPDFRDFLDIGSGTGDFAFTLAGRGHHGILVDDSEASAQIIRSRIVSAAPEGVEFIQADFTHHDFSRSFDLVIAFEVLEHVADDVGFLRNMVAVTATEGWVLISVPARQKLWGESDVAVGHVRRYEKRHVQQLMESAGLRTVRLISYGYPWLNMLKWYRDRLYKHHRATWANKSAAELTALSGVRPLPMRYWRLFDQLWFWRPFIAVSRLFESRDLAEGYLCLAHKAVPAVKKRP